MKKIPFGVQYVLCIYSEDSGDLNFLTEDEIFIIEDPSFG